jgi:hypothetical protein
MFATILQQLGPKPGHGPRRSARLQVEALENRAVPSAFGTGNTPFLPRPDAHVTAAVRSVGVSGGSGGGVINTSGVLGFAHNGGSVTAAVGSVGVSGGRIGGVIGGGTAAVGSVGISGAAGGGVTSDRNGGGSGGSVTPLPEGEEMPAL